LEGATVEAVGLVLAVGAAVDQVVGNLAEASAEVIRVAELAMVAVTLAALGNQAAVGVAVPDSKVAAGAAAVGHSLRNTQDVLKCSGETTT
jgi:uncharacterized membrane protein YadS